MKTDFPYVPQANSLPQIRQIVEAASQAPRATLRELGEMAVGLSARHAAYYGRAAADVLGLVEEREGRLETTPAGRELLRTPPGSAQERDVLAQQIRLSEALRAIAPGLVDPPEIEHADLAAAIEAAGYSPSTAARRAHTLLVWRKYVLERQQDLALGPAAIAPTNRELRPVTQRGGGGRVEDFIEISDFGPIGRVRMAMGQFTVIVGPQASGKSLALQFWKLAVDRGYILPYLRRAGVAPSSVAEMLDTYLGEGMQHAWRPATRINTSVGALSERALVSHMGRPKSEHERVFYVPAHRSLLLAIANGWPLRFQQLPDAPFVARAFSERLNLELSRSAADLFPQPRKLKQGLRSMVNDAVLRGAKVVLEQRRRQKQLRLAYEGDADIGYMTWTAGQREFVPLLLGLYELLPSRGMKRHPFVEWVIVEEPEMGLHPRAVRAVAFLLLELAYRGYRVIVSTHSPMMLDVIWGITRIRERLGSSAKAMALVRKMFDVEPEPGINGVAKSSLEMDFRVFALRYGDDGLTESVDISTLDPSSEDFVVAGWGGLTGLSSNIADAVGEAMESVEAPR